MVQPVLEPRRGLIRFFAPLQAARHRVKAARGCWARAGTRRWAPAANTPS